MRLNLRIEEGLKAVLNSLVEAIKERLGEDLISLVLYRQTFEAEVLDNEEVNLAIICSRRPSLEDKIYILKRGGPSLIPLFLTPRDFRELAKGGALLAHCLAKYSKVIHGKEALEKLIEEEPPMVTKHTLEFLRRASLSCLSLSLEDYLSKRIQDVRYHLLRSFDYLIKWVALKKGLDIPFSKAEIIEVVSLQGIEPELNELCWELVNKGAFDSEVALRRALKLYPKVLKVKLPSLTEVIKEVRGLKVLRVGISIRGNRGSFLITLIDGEVREVRIGG